MVCLYCGSSTSVINSRSQRRQNTIWRRRACATCGNIVTTQEVILFSRSVLVRTPHNRKLEPFLRDKLFVSILESCRHRARAFEEANALTETVMAKLLQELSEGVIERAAIVRIAQQTLEPFDPIAATLYGAHRTVRN